MKDLRDIIKRPVITEESADLMAEKKYTVEVTPKANKTEIKHAVETSFGGKGVKINKKKNKSKYKTMGRYGGQRSCRKKGIGQLARGSKEVGFFEAEPKGY